MCKSIGLGIKWPENYPSLKAEWSRAIKLVPLDLSFPTCTMAHDTVGPQETTHKKHSKKFLTHKETLSVPLEFSNDYSLQKKQSKGPKLERNVQN